MDIFDCITLLGGVALFLYGMTLMGEGLKQVAGNKLEVILYKLSGTPLKGILLGTGVTAVIQSSSATSVMVVGFVNSGMMKVRQAISIIMGAVIGTSITGWIISLSELGGGGGITALFSTENLSAIVAIVGIYLRMFTKKESNHSLGNIMMGFAILMFGMKSMSSSVSGLRSSQTFINALTTFSNPILGILIGAVFTTVIQSASAAVGILQALSSTGAITFQVAFPIIIGIGIGAAVPVLLSALGSSTDGKRTALSYLVTNGVGGLILGLVFYIVNAVAGFSFMNLPLTAVTIALVNTIYRVVLIVFLLPVIGIIEKIVNVIVKDTPKKVEPELQYLDRLEVRFVKYPPLAVENTRTVMNHMAKLTIQNVNDAVTLYRKGYTEEGYAEVKRIEDIIDVYEDAIGTYLMSLTGRAMTRELGSSVAKYLRAITDLERISDRALNIAKVSREINEKKTVFTEDGKKEIETALNAVQEEVTLALQSFINNDVESAYKVEPLCNVILKLCKEMKKRHTMRLTEGLCTLEKGYILNDLVVNFERIAGHCSNTTATMVEVENGILGHHDYTNKAKHEHVNNYEDFYQEYSERYSF